MPGKQLAIDADLNAGAIDSNEAQRRRLEVTKQADFYGAMDGASKFVKGDAIAAIIITLVNLVGGFAVGIHGIDAHLARFKADNDDYSDILLKALADRFAEAFAERLHQYVRTTLWAYAPGEQLKIGRAHV